MKTIGLLGGMSWESTITYYKIINENIREQLGGLHSAKIVLYSVDFHMIEECQAKGEWDRSAVILSEAAINLEKAGADFILICTNTMHKVVDNIQKQINIPIIHIAKATASKLLEENVVKVALLGTKYTMQQDFYKDKLIEKGIEVLIPEDDDIEYINNVIFNELCIGIKLKSSKEKFITIIEKLKQKGAQGIILGCTEIGMLIGEDDTTLPVFDTTRIHAIEAVRLAMK